MISSDMPNPVEHFGLTKEQKEQLDLLSNYHKQNLITDKDFDKYKQNIIDGTFKLDEEDDDPFHLMSSSSSDDDDDESHDHNEHDEHHKKTKNNNGSSASNGKCESTASSNLEKMDETNSAITTTGMNPNNNDNNTENHDGVVVVVGVGGEGVATTSTTSIIAPVQVEVSVEQVDFVRKESTGIIGIATKTLDLDIMEPKPVEISQKYKENYGFDLADDEGNVKEMKELFEKHRDFNAKKIESQRKRWQEFIQKHNIPAKGFATLEDYEQQRVFHFIEESNDFKKLVRKGIPMEYRAVMWYIISGANYQYLTHKDVFENLKEKALAIPVEEREKDKNFVVICKDVDRTFPTHPFFKDPHNQIALRNVLYLYSLHNPKVGYCQSMNFLAGIMLVVGMSVQQTFFTLDRIIDRYMPPDLYDSSMEGVYSESFVLQHLCLDRIPKVANQLLKFDPNYFILISPNWFLCLYLTSFPIETSLRIWDCFIHEKYKILYRIGMTYLSLLEKEILKTGSDFQSVFMAIKDTSQKMFDCRQLIKKSFGIRNFSKKKILSYRELYRQQQSNK